MTSKKVHIGFKGIILLLSLALLLPSAIKLAHAFASHEHQACIAPQAVHFHEFYLDCEFYKFKTGSQIVFEVPGFNGLYLLEQFAIPTSDYSFNLIPGYSAFSLRGPPVTI